MKLCDLHCDTAANNYRRGYTLTDSPGAITLDKIAAYERYIQLMAVFTYTDMDNEAGWQTFFAVKKQLEEQCTANRLHLCGSFSALRETLAASETGTAFLLTVEDARILNGHLERLEVLAKAGVSVLTPLWRDVTCIGGAHNTDAGLSDFGRAVVEGCFDLGLAVDISHASTPSGIAIMDMAERKGGRVLATHSNAYAVHPHTRNIPDEILRRLAELDGIVGVNFYVSVLSGEDPRSTDDVLRHIEHLARVIGEDRVALGADWDGAVLPPDLCDISCVPKLIPALEAHGFGKDFAEGLFYRNACRFLTDSYKTKSNSPCR